VRYNRGNDVALGLLSAAVVVFRDKSRAVGMITEEGIPETARMGAVMGIQGQAPIVAAMRDLARLTDFGIGKDVE
jgi:hypothetical protein